MNEELELERGTGDIWSDLDYPDADIRRAKSILAIRIMDILDNQNLSIREAANITGFAAADFSKVRNANLGRFTLDRLIRMLHSLDGELTVTVDVRSKKQSIGA